MNIYNIFRHSSGRIEAVKVGWSWPAFGFTAFWAISKRMWMLGLGVLLGIYVIFYLVAVSADPVAAQSTELKPNMLKFRL